MLKGYTGRVLHDIRRQLDEIPEGPLRKRVLDKLVLVSRLLHQPPTGRGRIYALHEPEVDCISKGKARIRYEFGTKVSIATTRTGGCERTQVVISGASRGLTPALAKALRRHSSIEPEIGHMKTDGRLARCVLKGTLGDARFAVLCGCGHNIRKILAHPRALLVLFVAVVLEFIRSAQHRQSACRAA